MLRQSRVGLVRKCSSDNFLHAGFARSISELSRINAVTRDNPENVWRLHIPRLTTGQEWRKDQWYCQRCRAEHRMFKQALAAASGYTTASAQPSSPRRLTCI